MPNIHHVASEMAVTSVPVSSLNVITFPFTVNFDIHVLVWFIDIMSRKAVSTVSPSWTVDTEPLVALRAVASYMLAVVALRVSRWTFLLRVSLLAAPAAPSSLLLMSRVGCELWLLRLLSIRLPPFVRLRCRLASLGGRRWRIASTFSSLSACCCSWTASLWRMVFFAFPSVRSGSICSLSESAKSRIRTTR